MLVFEEVRRRFARTEALCGLSLSVRPGEVMGLLGPNGAGKSTAIGLATGLLAVTGGRVRVDGLDPRHPMARRSIGLAPQSLALYDTLTPLENLVVFARLAGMSRSEARTAADRLLHRVGLDDHRSRRVATLSGGMKRRLNLAVALVHDPKLVLLDEPTANVDPQSRHEIFEIVRSLREAGRTVVYCTHYMEEAERLCDRVAVIDRGRVIALGSPGSLIANAGGLTTIEFERDGRAHRIMTDEPAATLARLLGEGEVHRLRLHQPDLETLFLRLTGRSLNE